MLRAWAMRCLSSAVSSFAYMPLASAARAMSSARRPELFIRASGHEAEDPVGIAGAGGLEAGRDARAALFGVGAHGGNLRVGVRGGLGGGLPRRRRGSRRAARRLSRARLRSRATRPRRRSPPRPARCRGPRARRPGASPALSCPLRSRRAGACAAPRTRAARVRAAAAAASCVFLEFFGQGGPPPG